MLTKEIFDLRPKLDSVPLHYGKEPCIRDLILEYYLRNEVPTRMAQAYTKEYMEKIQAEFDK